MTHATFRDKFSYDLFKDLKNLLTGFEPFKLKPLQNAIANSTPNPRTNIRFKPGISRISILTTIAHNGIGCLGSKSISNRNSITAATTLNINNSIINLINYQDLLMLMNYL